jgi:hypothetical protein
MFNNQKRGEYRLFTCIRLDLSTFIKFVQVNGFDGTYIDILSASTVGFSKFFFWIHFVEPTTKMRMKIRKLRHIVSKTMHYLVVRRVEGEAFYQLGRGRHNGLLVWSSTGIQHQ